MPSLAGVQARQQRSFAAQQPGQRRVHPLLPLVGERDQDAPVCPDQWSLVGGGVEPGESFSEAALRELEEEAGIALGPNAELVPYSRWITPAEVKIRYDTWFYLAAMPAGVEPEIDGLHPRF